MHNNSISAVQPNLGFLVDRWGAPQWLPLANVFSVGDVLIAVGTIVAIVAAMKAPTRQEVFDRGGANLACTPAHCPRPTN